MTSKVWFLTPYTAETIKTTKSVTVAPLSLILIKASCPGVSINVTLFYPSLILKAPIFWVIPPSYLSAILLFRR